MMIAVNSGCSSLWNAVICLILSSIIFTLIGMIIALQATSLNAFIVLSIPVEMILLVPVVLQVCGRMEGVTLYVPSSICMHLRLDEPVTMLSWIIVCFVIIVLYIVACRCVDQNLIDHRKVKIRKRQSYYADSFYHDCKRFSGMSVTLHPVHCFSCCLYWLSYVTGNTGCLY